MILIVFMVQGFIIFIMYAAVCGKGVVLSMLGLLLVLIVYEGGVPV